MSKRIHAKRATLEAAKMLASGNRWGRRLLNRTPLNPKPGRRYEYHATKGWRNYRA